MQQKLY